ncbi:hypothetical protein CC85DRAFT_329588 [Cutaneotrichosporon oleaginosum]|uniref:Uncharacterized protein n=1 Tax=Cutaneotrichosporon oleaginosum TaxID=879819 RepID=A0A0J0XIA4_9TREE|nr:uncharacterized protein CC85DRAFT_329588 [Cutaneotrichosporon oleaginosum]KLT40813.1 hypothetical protein CC85DRAFT_329588 [Cutaneotrichosporon oleaginosum]TXT11875.1 hypothetical protein COLE_02285 [Cutaneotrichosporon oleaginosum]
MKWPTLCRRAAPDPPCVSPRLELFRQRLAEVEVNLRGELVCLDLAAEVSASVVSLPVVSVPVAAVDGLNGDLGAHDCRDPAPASRRSSPANLESASARPVSVRLAPPPYRDWPESSSVSVPSVSHSTPLASLAPLAETPSPTPPTDATPLPHATRDQKRAEIERLRAQIDVLAAASVADTPKMRVWARRPAPGRLWRLFETRARR